MAVLANAEAVGGRWPPISRAIAGPGPRSGLIATATGDESYDFVSRYLRPAKGYP